ncbi:nuclease-related domain-containing protein [Shewanella khirikhana]|uniref:Nuclease-related domain protein n=1 Tax=Shewanella khirikhana TaxID=1965282 RepID=A0ABM7DBH5_9GAMM|nr:nuclease-related domain-containing protein [Shewanella khirikhana]AZQ11258.1 Nuclease-related domain protein [Shewanella khirikhana]
MILKDKQLTGSDNPMIAAGEKQESSVAFFLRRAFKDHPDVMVFNDLQLSHNGESAQIDHLIVYTFGFILIESKSITGEVKVNSHQEWSRSWQGKWQGIASPIKQVELQTSLLQQLLIDNRANILPKFLMLQQGFGGRCWHSVCAISSNAIIEREAIPKDISKRLVKSEFLVDKLLEIMNLKGTLSQLINVLDTRPAFNKNELAAICDFLLKESGSPVESNIKENIAAYAASESTALNQSAVVLSPLTQLQITCKHCDSPAQLQPNWGQYGYYVKCGHCSGNTPMKRPCPSCQSKETKVSKRGNDYNLNCNQCGDKTALRFC